jgi:hypothetical protein
MIRQFEFEVSARMKQSDNSLMKLIRRIPHNERKEFAGFAWVSLEPIDHRKAKAIIVGITPEQGITA